MKNTLRRLEIFSFFDHTGIAVHLEKMAEKGWMIEKLTNFGWKYRRMEPKKIRFAVSYYPKASEFDPEPSEEQKMFHEFCAHTGWKLACTSAQLQIFYNENEDPVPIETEPVLELQTIHRSVKRGMLPSYLLLMVVAVLNGAMFISRLFGDPIGLLASPSSLFSGFTTLLLAVLCAVELIVYYKWYSKAKIAAEQGEFLSSSSTAKFQKGVLLVVGIGVVYWVISYLLSGPLLRRVVGIMMFIYMPLLIVIVNGTKEFLKRKKVSKKVNFAVTMAVDFIFAFGLMGLIGFGILKASNKGLFAENGEETYEHGGITWVIHQDELPLIVEDLIEIDYDGYIREKRGDSSILLSQLVMHQGPRFDAENYADIPQLEYTLVVVHVPALYDMCKNRMIYEQEEQRPIQDLDYRKEDEAPWGAKEVYRLYDLEYGARNTYLVCYDKMLAEIRFDWEPTEEQMAIVGEKLT